MISLAQHMQPWWSIPLVVVDTETTGVDTAACMVVELAAVRFEGGKPVARAATLVNPGIPIPPEVSAIHGITDAMVADAPDMHRALREMDFARLCAGAWPCGYNGQSFDRPIVHRLVGCTTEYAALRPDAVWLDPLVVVRHVDRWVKGPGRHKLTAACARRGIQVEGAHRAMGDAEAAGRLLWSMRDEGVIGGLRTLAELLDWQRSRAARQEADFAQYRARAGSSAS